MSKLLYKYVTINIHNTKRGCRHLTSIHHSVQVLQVPYELGKPTSKGGWAHKKTGAPEARP